MFKNRKVNIILAVSLLIALTAGIVGYAAKDKTDKTPSYGSEKTSQYEVLTNRHTQYVKVEEAKCQLTTDGFEEKLNNGTLSIWYNKDMEALRMVDLRSGYVWGCIDDKEEYNLNKKWTARATSMLYITYFNMKGKEESAGLSDSAFKTKYQWKKDSFSCKVSASRLGIEFTFTGTLKDDQFTFAMKDETLKESGRGKLSKISFMSFLGSVYEDTIPGYMLVPDGSGALIRFQKAKAYLSGYSRKVYGADLSMDTDASVSNLNGNRTDDYATEENRLSFPLWGVVHGENQNGLLATIDSGELYAMINAIPAGAENQTVKFSRAYADFIYRNEYNKRVSNAKVVKEPQETPNTVNPTLTFTFLTNEEADYVGMANRYREKLLKADLLPKNEIETKGDVSLLLHIAGSEVKEGFLKNGLETLTTAEQAEEILKDLKKSDITNVSMILSGWNKGGYHGAKVGSTKFEGKVGSEKDLLALRKTLQKQGGDLALVTNVITANKDQINIRQDVALNATLDSIVKTIPNKNLMYQDTYFLRHAEVVKALDKNFDKLEEFGLVLEDAAKYLHADYTIGKEKTRIDVMEEMTSKIAEAKQDLYFDAENLYMLKYASKIIDIPVSGSQYIYETDSVPFLQIVLRGSVDYYTPYSNLGFYSDASVLKMIEYGAYPSFMVMAEDNFSISDTPLENYFSLNYQDWKVKIESVYKDVNATLSKVKGAEIIDHEVVAEGIYKTSYANGVSIYVNYTGEDYVTEGGVTVPECGYAVEESK